MNPMYALILIAAPRHTGVGDGNHVGLPPTIKLGELFT
jgi:hypothetical protein